MVAQDKEILPPAERVSNCNRKRKGKIKKEEDGEIYINKINLIQGASTAPSA
jgi:hypothetical protein